jgi:hypothetical protein
MRFLPPPSPPPVPYEPPSTSPVQVPRQPPSSPCPSPAPHPPPPPPPYPFALLLDRHCDRQTYGSYYSRSTAQYVCAHDDFCRGIWDPGCDGLPPFALCLTLGAEGAPLPASTAGDAQHCVYAKARPPPPPALPFPPRDPPAPRPLLGGSNSAGLSEDASPRSGVPEAVVWAAVGVGLAWMLCASVLRFRKMVPPLERPPSLPVDAPTADAGVAGRQVTMGRWPAWAWTRVRARVRDEGWRLAGAWAMWNPDTPHWPPSEYNSARSPRSPTRRASPCDHAAHPTQASPGTAGQSAASQSAASSTDGSLAGSPPSPCESLPTRSSHCATGEAQPVMGVPAYGPRNHSFMTTCTRVCNSSSMPAGPVQGVPIAPHTLPSALEERDVTPSILGANAQHRSPSAQRTLFQQPGSTFSGDQQLLEPV